MSRIIFPGYVTHYLFVVILIEDGHHHSGNGLVHKLQFFILTKFSG